MEDNELLEYFFARKETAITEVANTYGSYCAAVSGRILRAEEDIQEVLNDTWLRAWNAIPPEKPNNLKLYLTRITRNLSFDRFRSQSRLIRGSGELTLALDEQTDCIPAETNPEQLLEGNELHRAVNQFLGTLKKTGPADFSASLLLCGNYRGHRQTVRHPPGAGTRHSAKNPKKLKDHLTKDGCLHG